MRKHVLCFHQQPRCATLAYNTYSCWCLPSSAPPASPSATFSNHFYKGQPQRPIRPQPLIWPLVYSPHGHWKTTSTGLKVITPIDGVWRGVWQSFVAENGNNKWKHNSTVKQLKGVAWLIAFFSSFVVLLLPVMDCECLEPTSVTMGLRWENLDEVHFVAELTQRHN